MQHSTLPTRLNRDTVLGWLQQTVAALEALPRDAFHVETVAPAGLPVEIWFDDAALAETYCARLAGWKVTAPPVARHIVLTGRHPDFLDVPEWCDAALPAGAFQRLMEGAGLKVSFEDRNWRIYDAARGLAAQISRREGLLRPWEAGLLLIDWTVQQTGLALAHAGTLGLDGRGLLLAGQSKSGKSGTTLAGMVEGLQTVGDDFVALASEPAAIAKAVFPYARQDPAGIDRIAGLRERLPAHRINHLGKLEFDLRDTFPGAFVDMLPLDAVVLPRRAGLVEPQLVPISAAEAMVELLRSNPFRYVGDPASRVHRFARLARQVPCYRLDLSPDGRRNGRALRGLLEGLG